MGATAQPLKPPTVQVVRLSDGWSKNGERG